MSAPEAFPVQQFYHDATEISHSGLVIATANFSIAGLNPNESQRIRQTAFGVARFALESFGEYTALDDAAKKEALLIVSAGSNNAGEEYGGINFVSRDPRMLIRALDSRPDYPYRNQKHMGSLLLDSLDEIYQRAMENKAVVLDPEAVVEILVRDLQEQEREQRKQQ